MGQVEEVGADRLGEMVVEVVVVEEVGVVELELVLVLAQWHAYQRVGMYELCSILGRNMSSIELCNRVYRHGLLVLLDL